MVRACRSREEWHELIQLWQGGDQGVGAFCREQGLTQSRFYFWRTRFGAVVPAAISGERGAAASPPVSVSEVSEGSDWHMLSPAAVSPASVSAEPSSWQVELDLPGGMTLRVRS